jgi:hypothetical protein
MRLFIKKRAENSALSMCHIALHTEDLTSSDVICNNG